MDEEIEGCFNGTSNITDGEKANYTILIGNFNTKLGTREDRVHIVRKFAPVKRKERSEMLVNLSQIQNDNYELFFSKAKGL